MSRPHLHRGVALAIAGAGSAYLAGCQVGPNYRAPTPPSGTDAPLVSLDPALETPSSPPVVWWRLYNDQRLDELVSEALLANRDLASRLVMRAPEQVRTAAWLYHVDGMDQAEGAAVLGVSSRTVVNYLATFARHAKKFLSRSAA